MNQFQHIVSNQGILGGKPCIKGTRISVQLILEWVAVGTTIQEILEKYSHLNYDDVLEAISFSKK